MLTHVYLMVHIATLLVIVVIPKFDASPDSL